MPDVYAEAGQSRPPPWRATSERPPLPSSAVSRPIVDFHSHTTRLHHTIRPPSSHRHQPPPAIPPPRWAPSYSPYQHPPPQAIPRDASRYLETDPYDEPQPLIHRGPRLVSQSPFQVSRSSPFEPIPRYPPADAYSHIHRVQRHRSVHRSSPYSGGPALDSGSGYIPASASSPAYNSGFASTRAASVQPIHRHATVGLLERKPSVARSFQAFNPKPSNSSASKPQITKKDISFLLSSGPAVQKSEESLVPNEQVSLRESFSSSEPSHATPHTSLSLPVGSPAKQPDSLEPKSVQNPALHDPVPHATSLSESSLASGTTKSIDRLTDWSINVVFTWPNKLFKHIPPELQHLSQQLDALHHWIVVSGNKLSNQQNGEQQFDEWQTSPIVALADPPVSSDGASRVKTSSGSIYELVGPHQVHITNEKIKQTWQKWKQRLPEEGGPVPALDLQDPPTAYTIEKGFVQDWLPAFVSVLYDWEKGINEASSENDTRPSLSDQVSSARHVPRKQRVSFAKQDLEVGFVHEAPSPPHTESVLPPEEKPSSSPTEPAATEPVAAEQDKQDQASSSPLSKRKRARTGKQTHGTAQSSSSIRVARESQPQAETRTSRRAKRSRLSDTTDNQIEVFVEIQQQPTANSPAGSLRSQAHAGTTTTTTPSDDNPLLFNDDDLDPSPLAETNAAKEVTSSAEQPIDLPVNLPESDSSKQQGQGLGAAPLPVEPEKEPPATRRSSRNQTQTLPSKPTSPKKKVASPTKRSPVSPIKRSKLRQEPQDPSPKPSTSNVLVKPEIAFTTPVKVKKEDCLTNLLPSGTSTTLSREVKRLLHSPFGVNPSVKRGWLEGCSADHPIDVDKSGYPRNQDGNDGYKQPSGSGIEPGLSALSSSSPADVSEMATPPNKLSMRRSVLVRSARSVASLRSNHGIKKWWEFNPITSPIVKYEDKKKDNRFGTAKVKRSQAKRPVRSTSDGDGSQEKQKPKKMAEKEKEDAGSPSQVKGKKDKSKDNVKPQRSTTERKPGRVPKPVTVKRQAGSKSAVLQRAKPTLTAIKKKARAKEDVAKPNTEPAKNTKAKPVKPKKGHNIPPSPPPPPQASSPPPTQMMEGDEGRDGRDGADNDTAFTFFSKFRTITGSSNPNTDPTTHLGFGMMGDEYYFSD